MREFEYRFKPIVEWPRKLTPDHERKHFPFKSKGQPTPLSTTYADLDRELRHVGAKDPVYIQVALSDRDIRQDGRPRTDARKPAHPGVILMFEAVIGGRVTPLNFACDDCRRWEDNLRAIVKTLEHLRGADRYGVTKSGEQYKGWAALPGAGKALVTAPRMTVDEAARVLAAGRADLTPGHLIDSPDATRAAFREKAKAGHPDAGGDAGLWQKLLDAKDMLDRHHAGQS